MWMIFVYYFFRCFWILGCSQENPNRILCVKTKKNFEPVLGAYAMLLAERVDVVIIRVDVMNLYDFKNQ